MALREGARRMGVLANLMVIGSMFFLLLSWRLSVTLFLGGWAIYGAAYLIDGFASNRPEPRQAIQ